MRSTANMTTTHTIMTPDFNTMTPAQQKRLSELMMRNINAADIMHAPVFPVMPSAMPRVGIPITDIDSLLDDLERQEKERAERRERELRERLETMFNREELFRFAYVPFVIAELVWDYADTVIIMAQQLNDPACRRLSRAIRNARAEYDHLRHQYIDAQKREREIENGYVFENATKRITNQMMLNVRIDINREYPALNEESRDLLLAVYQCHITSRALLRYLDRESAKVSKRVGHTIGKMLPPSYYVMDKLIPEYIGDKPASARFRKLMNEYINTFATQIALIELNDVPEDN